MSFKREKRIRNIIRIIPALLSIAYLFLGVCLSVSGALTTSTATFLICGIMLLVFVIVVKPIQKAGIKGRMKGVDRSKDKCSDYPDDGKREYYFFRNGIAITSNLGESYWKWEAVAFSGDVRHYIFFTLINREVILVDKNTMPEEAIETLQELIQEKMGERK